jgi:hypothetical protein
MATVDDVAARIGRVRSGSAWTGVVVVLGVGRIDGDERDVAPVLAPLERHLALASSAVEVVDGDHADRPLALRVADDR